MNKIKLDTLTLSDFDKTNIEHINFFKKLSHDKSIESRFQGLGVGLLHTYDKTFFDRGFFVQLNDKLIGYLNVGNFNELENCVYLREAIDENLRGNSYGKLLLKEITEYIFSNYMQVEKIIIKIAPDNIPSLNTASSCGYKLLCSDYYYSSNPYLEMEPLSRN
ncbi:MAG: GNAT family N-acetyltransferase [Bacilli bacterium]